MIMSNAGEKGNLRIKVKDEVMEVDTFQYLWLDFASNGRMDAELYHRSMEVRKSAGVLKSVRKNRNVWRNSCTYSFVWQWSWGLEYKVKNRMDVAEMSCLRSTGCFNSPSWFLFSIFSVSTWRKVVIFC